ncbi:hypothetical protein CJ999_33110 [Bacillus thuringiensis]|nr:hypothetical protein AC241_31085 [Bacillus thuringiensis]MBZ8126113.1 hypothetical protein [Bacillus thuringiensis]
MTGRCRRMLCQAIREQKRVYQTRKNIVKKTQKIQSTLNKCLIKKVHFFFYFNSIDYYLFVLLTIKKYLTSLTLGTLPILSWDFESRFILP